MISRITAPRRHGRSLRALGLTALLVLTACVGEPALPSGWPTSPPITITMTPAPPTSAAGGGEVTATAAPPSPTPEAAAPPSATPLAAPPTAAGAPGGKIQTVFVIVMENHNWADILHSASAPYINDTLLPAASSATKYFNPPGIHPSEPNYLWLEAGQNFGVRNDSSPAANHQATTQHLVSLLTAQGLTWKSYQEGISGTNCPLSNRGLYATKHNPMIYFDDVTDGLSPTSANCIAHVRPYTQLAGDLTQNTVARYNFITPNLCNDMHNSSGCATSNSVRNGDTWLATAVPPILNSAAYRDGGVLFITWDEGEGGADGPIGLIALSPFAKGQGYTNSVRYTHSSLLRTVQEIFGVTPLLGDAANATDLSDLFQQFP
jgi:phosphatidylinositol-3-phosphatase